MTPLTVESLGQVELVTLQRPGRLNALDQPLAAALFEYFESRRRHAAVRAILLTGTGKGFCAGADIKAHRDPGGQPLEGLREGDWLLRDLVKAMRACPQPIVALINGAAVGGGLALALACDVLIASPAASFSTAFLRVGLTGTELGAGWRLQRLLGPALARDLAFTSRALSAQEALQYGLVSRLVGPDRLLEEGRAIVADMLKAAPDALRLTKRSLDACLELGSVDAALELEERGQLLCLARAPDPGSLPF